MWPGVREMIATENRSAQCKIYVEPTVKKAIEAFAVREGLTFSEAGRALLLNADELKYELNRIALEKSHSQYQEERNE